MEGDRALVALCGGCIVGMLFALFIFAATGNMPGTVEARTRQEAADAGAAEWRIDSVTGERSFHWLPKETEQDEKVPE